MWIAVAAIPMVAIAVGIWFATQHGSRRKSRQHAAMSSLADMSTPPNDNSMESAAANADLQVELGPDDLKKAQVQTAHVDVKETSSTLRVPGVVEPKEYHDVHVTPLVGGVTRQVSVVLGDHVRRGQPMAVIFSSDLADAETGYLAMLAELEADHKKLERTQKLVKLGAASQQEEDDVPADHAAHEAHARAALARLQVLGSRERQVAALKQPE